MKLKAIIKVGEIGIIEVSDIEATDTTLDRKVNQLKTLIELNYKPNRNNIGIEPNEKQLALISRIGGDMNKKFKSYDELNTYIDQFKEQYERKKEAREAQRSANAMQTTQDHPTPPPVVDEDPWDIDL